MLNTLKLPSKDWNPMIQLLLDLILIQKLGDSDFLIRDKATQTLITRGPINLLNIEVFNEDIEIRHRCRYIMKKLATKHDITKMNIKLDYFLEPTHYETIKNKEYKKLIATMILALDEDDITMIINNCDLETFRYIVNFEEKITNDKAIVENVLTTCFRQVIIDSPGDILEIEIDTEDAISMWAWTKFEEKKGDEHLIRFKFSHNTSLLFTIREVNFIWKITAIGVN